MWREITEISEIWKLKMAQSETDLDTEWEKDELEN